jgi:hypothetical protein
LISDDKINITIPCGATINLHGCPVVTMHEVVVSTYRANLPFMIAERRQELLPSEIELNDEIETTSDTNNLSL